MLTKDDLTRIATIVKAETEPLKQGQAQTDTTLMQIKTTVEALEAGQQEIREDLATKADKAVIQDLKAEVVKKIKKQDERLNALEEHTGSPNPHKN